eukprot:7978738-Alexandrium_andersonii.AAC.1
MPQEPFDPPAHPLQRPLTSRRVRRTHCHASQRASAVQDHQTRVRCCAPDGCSLWRRRGLRST